MYTYCVPSCRKQQSERIAVSAQTTAKLKVDKEQCTPNLPLYRISQITAKEISL